MKIGILGGTFDPPHFGHLLIAQYCLEELALEKIIFIPSGNPPHKLDREVTDEKIRYEMTKLAIENNDKFCINDIEMGTDELNYTVNTLEKINNEINENDEIYYIIGEDSLDNIESWWNYNKIFKLTKIVVINRITDNETKLNDKLQVYIKRYNTDIYSVTMPYIQLSSTTIRNRIKNNLSCRYMMPEQLLTYIEKKKLYE